MSAGDSLWRQQVVKQKFDHVNRSLSLLQPSTHRQPRSNPQSVFHSNPDQNSQDADSSSPSEVSMDILRELRQEHEDLSRIANSASSFISPQIDFSFERENRPNYQELVRDRRRTGEKVGIRVKKESGNKENTQETRLFSHIRRLERENKRLEGRVAQLQGENAGYRKENKERTALTESQRTCIEDLEAEICQLQRMLAVSQEAKELRKPGSVKPISHGLILALSKAKDKKSGSRTGP